MSAEFTLLPVPNKALPRAIIEYLIELTHETCVALGLKEPQVLVSPRDGWYDMQRFGNLVEYTYFTPATTTMDSALPYWARVEYTVGSDARFYEGVVAHEVTHIYHCALRGWRPFRNDKPAHNVGFYRALEDTYYAMGLAQSEHLPLMVSFEWVYATNFGNHAAAKAAISIAERAGWTYTHYDGPADARLSPIEQRASAFTMVT